MSSERSQVLALLAARRIDVDQAERLLALVGGRDRFLTLALWTIILLIAVSANLSQIPLGNGTLAALRSALQSVIQSLNGSEAFHNLHTFLCRFLGELP
jgi:hypothetical protein